jgi:hypothetical protein
MPDVKVSKRASARVATARYFGPGANKPPEVWLRFYQLAFEATPPLSQHSICRQLGISRLTGRGMWVDLAACRRAGNIHPKLKEAGHAA